MLAPKKIFIKNQTTIKIYPKRPVIPKATSTKGKKKYSDKNFIGGKKARIPKTIAPTKE